MMSIIRNFRMNTIGRLFSISSIILLIASCSKEQVGNPYMLFEIHGTVMDADGKPIEGIQVSSGVSEIQTTNVNGNFVFYGRSAPTTYVVLTFEDKDGTENSGEFVKRQLDVLVHEKTPGSETGNFRGTYFASGVEVVMLQKKDELNPDSGLLPF